VSQNPIYGPTVLGVSSPSILAAGGYRIPIRAAIEAVHAEGCSCGSEPEHPSLGSEDQVSPRCGRVPRRAALRARGDDRTFAAGMPTDELVEEIQRDVEATGAAQRPGRPPGRAAPSRSPASQGGRPGDERPHVFQGVEHA